MKRKIKEIMFIQNKNLKEIIHQKTVSPVRRFRMKSTFNLEEEAAQLAYRQGRELPANYFFQVNSPQDTDVEEEFVPISTTDKEITVRDWNRLIEKLERKVGMEEKEGWEALYM